MLPSGYVKKCYGYVVDAIRVCEKSVRGMCVLPSGYVQGAIRVCKKVLGVCVSCHRGM